LQEKSNDFLLVLKTYFQTMVLKTVVVMKKVNLVVFQFFEHKVPKLGGGLAI
jgi:hypothetical protein